MATLETPPGLERPANGRGAAEPGAGQVADALKPLGVSAADVHDLIEKGREQAKSQAGTGQVLNGALIVTQTAATIILILVLTFFFLKDGTQLRDWTLCLFAR